MLTPGDQLLYIISARHRLPWAFYKNAFDYLWLHTRHEPVYASDVAPVSIAFARLGTTRALDSLGHCEFDFDARTVHASPPALARLPQAGLPRAVLVGSRVPNTISELKQIARSGSATVRVSVEPQPNPALLAPAVVTVQAISVEELAQVSAALGIAFDPIPAAWSLIHLAPSLDEYLGAQRWTPRLELNWSRQDFDPNHLQFDSPGSNDNKDIRLSDYTDPARQLHKHYLVRGHQQAEIDRNWGRFAVLHYLGVNVVSYDPARFAFSVPASVPLPALMARTLVLCSGRSPIVLDCTGETHDQFLRLVVFNGVPPQVAWLAASKLGQELRELER